MNNNISDETKIKLPQKDEMVRTTFNISEMAVDAIQDLHSRLGLTANHIIQISLSSINIDWDLSNNDDKLKTYLAIKGKIRKAYAISKINRTNLNCIAKEKRIKRDELVEYLVINLYEKISSSFHIEIKKLKISLDLLNKLWTEINVVSEKILKLIDEDDEPEIHEAVWGIDGYWQEAYSRISDSIKEKEKLIEKYYTIFNK